MENEEIKNFLIGTSLTKVLLESSKEEYLEMGCDESKYEKRIEFAKYMVEKIDAASPRVRDLFHTVFKSDSWEEDQKLLNNLEQSDREELLALKEDLQAKEAELGLKEE
ncbi:hypothetical protein Y032_0003g1379 [Ancylostoma ceylanicum]|uniref:Uncharacterized protein n=1 Tax=Ancylostoma ceylanicum TaxID=53326 RepID=A0A016VYJ1_9BILA|nr:hypothetical protein Y032_0003g1379 [Ancylostoma ceylanicum]